ncbi:MAG TPA: LpxL/LpxP family Kdo(2)-lipid IV(A) lauroyl/palmitoleoyl acyltransferase [Gammaproteobacteria bacterium]|nr:LpxL/LpxP family Kdo(2)-lipid IV(A) lauroyl/palmitoleoyl acyltransferase [Gammaproteobacteria bacterium]
MNSVKHHKSNEGFRPSAFLHPRYWLTWLGLGALWLLSRLPFTLQMRLGSLLGMLMYHLARRRRHITRCNIGLCFPELDSAAQQMLIRKTFRSAGISLMETGLAWWGRDKVLARRVQVEGLEHLQRATALGKGVLLLGAHFTSLEISGRLLARFHPCAAMYRKHDNPLFEAIIKHSRETHLDKIISRRDMRGMVRALREGTVVWYATDQDFGPRNSVFAPFFGIQTASLVMTSKLARLSGAPVVPFFSQRLDDDSGYKLILLPALTDFPSGDDVADAARINAIIERQVRKVPDQYLWLHRRFKTRPEGESGLYSWADKKRTRDRDRQRREETLP